MNIIKLHSFLMEAGGELADVSCILRLYISTTQQSAGMVMAHYGMLGLSDVCLASRGDSTCCQLSGADLFSEQGVETCWDTRRWAGSVGLWPSTGSWHVEIMTKLWPPFVGEFLRAKRCMLITSAISVLERQWNVFASCRANSHLASWPRPKASSWKRDGKMPNSWWLCQTHSIDSSALIALGNDGTKSDPGGQTVEEPRACWVSYQDDQVDQANLPKPQLWPSTWL